MSIIDVCKCAPYLILLLTCSNGFSANFNCDCSFDG